MDKFRRTPQVNKKNEQENHAIAELKDTIRDLELDIFDLKKANADLIIENTQLKAWNTTADNQTTDWFGKSNPSLTSTSNVEGRWVEEINYPSRSVEVSETETGGGRERLSSRAMSRRQQQRSQLGLPAEEQDEGDGGGSSLLPPSYKKEEGTLQMEGEGERDMLMEENEIGGRMHRQDTIIFTNDSDFENFKISKLDIQMKCQVGKGSFGVVWKGLYRDGPVAVKLFLSAEIDIRSEVYAMSKVVGLEHVMDLIGVVEEPGDAFKPPQVALVMPFMSNGSLQDVCYRNSPTFMSHLTNEMKIKFCHQAAKGVLQLHKTGIIHRDLACRNLLVDDKMDVFVADFGFARLKHLAESKGFTLTGLGPVRWEAPESLQQKEFSEKTDAFSYGVCLYEIVMGSLPWEHLASTAMVAVNVINGMRMVVPINCDPVLAEVMSACWSPEPEHRPDFVSIARTLGERHQQVLAEEKDAERSIGTIEFMIRGEDVNKLPHQVQRKIVTKRPQQRFLRLTSDFQYVLWRSSAANSVFSAATRSRAAERGVLLRDVLEVLAGQQTDTFRLQQMELPAACSFSLVTAERSVDVVCGSSHHRDQWVAGLRQLLTRARVSVADMDLTRRLTWTLGGSNSIIGLDSFGLLRKVAYRLQRGDMLLKFTSRKVHARHVFLSSDLARLVWSVKEGAGPVRKGRSKSLLLSEIDSIVVGVQPERFHSNPGKHVTATASRLSERLILRATFAADFSLPSALQSKRAAASLVAGPQSRIRKHQADDDISHSQSKSTELTLSMATSSLLSRLFKDKDDKSKDDKERRKRNDAGVDRSADRTGDSSSMDGSSRFVKAGGGIRLGDGRGSELSTDENYHNQQHSCADHEGGDDETDSVVSAGGAAQRGEQHDHDHQLTVSYLAADGRTLLSLQCPHKESLSLWSDGVDALLQGADVLRRMSQAHQVHCYAHPRELFADSVGQPPVAVSLAEKSAGTQLHRTWSRAEESDSVPPRSSSDTGRDINDSPRVSVNTARRSGHFDHVSPFSAPSSQRSQSQSQQRRDTAENMSGAGLGEAGSSSSNLVDFENDYATDRTEKRESSRSSRTLPAEGMQQALPPLSPPAATLSPEAAGCGITSIGQEQQLTSRAAPLEHSAYELGDVLSSGSLASPCFASASQDVLSPYSLGDSMAARRPSSTSVSSSASTSAGSKVSRPLSVMAVSAGIRSEPPDSSSSDSSSSDSDVEEEALMCKSDVEDAEFLEEEGGQHHADWSQAPGSSLYEVMPSK